MPASRRCRDSRTWRVSVARRAPLARTRGRDGRRAGADRGGCDDVRRLFHWFDGWGESFDRVFELSTPVGQSVVDDGYRLMVVRAYADATTLRLAITAEDLEDRGWAELNVSGAVVHDAAGRVYEMSEGEFHHPGPEASESWLRFTVPPEATVDARQTLTVEIIAIGVRPEPAPTLANGEVDLDRVWTSVAGTWSFTFELQFLLTQTAHPGGSATVDGITVTWDELSVGPAAARASLTIHGLPEVPTDWAWDPDIRIERDGKPLAITVLEPGSVTRNLALEAEPGFAGLAGTWVITIDRFERDMPDPSSEVTTETQTLEGPWVIEFEGPAADGG